MILSIFYKVRQLGDSLLTAVDRSALAAPVHIDVPAKGVGVRTQKS